MTQVERQIRTAQHRLWVNRWLNYASRSVALCGAAFALVVLAQRLFELPLPLSWIGAGLGSAAVLASIIWTTTTREDAACAAAHLDEAAGLKERVSSGHYCRDSSDPFAQAVQVDAERVSASISVRQHIRLRAPNSLLLSTGSIVVAALMFLITPGVLKRAEAEGLQDRTVKAEQAKIAVKRKLDAIRDLAETTPVLEDLKENIEGLDKQAGGKLQNAGQIRHEAVKKIDKLADAVKQKRQSAKYDSVNEMRKMLRGLKVPKSSDAPTQKLAKALAQGDFKTAKQEINALKEQLATLKSEKDDEMVVKLSKQLEELSKQLEKLSQDDQLEKKIKQAGIKQEDLDRLLENLKKKDLDQLKKQLADKGLTQKDIEDITKRLKQKRQAQGMTSKLAQSMKKAGQCKSCDQAGDAIAGLSAAADQLTELEMLEQEMSQLDSTLTALQDAQDDLDSPCSQCSGTGMVNGKPCGKCQGKGRKPGPGMGQKMGQGSGGLAPEEQTNVGFKVERGKVHTGKGAIIGQVQFDGEQVKGDVSSAFTEVVTAAERDASDRINRDRVPRQYQKAVKAYFSSVQRSVQGAKGTKADSDKPAEGGAAKESGKAQEGEAGED